MLTSIPQEIRFDGCSLITGFHGIGATGYWTVKYLTQKLNAERVAFIDTDDIAPISSTIQGKLVTPYELFKSGNLVFFKAEAPPYKSGEVEFFREFAKWVVKAGFVEASLVGGLDSRLRFDDTTFRLVHTRSYKPSGFLGSAAKLEDEHVIVGPVAIMLNFFEVMNFPAFTILSYASTERFDPRATASAVDVLAKHYGFEVDVTPLIKGAEAMELEVTKQETRVTRGGESIYT